MDLQAVAHLSSNSQFECVKQGTPAPVQKIDMASIGIDEPAAAYRIWPKVPCRGQGRQNYIGVAAVEWLVYTMRADITDQRRQVRREFALDIEIPLHHVVAWGVALSGSVFERLWTEEPE